MSDSPLIILDHASFERIGGESALRDVTWSMRDGETWAIVGPTGCGKTTFAEVLLGKHHLTSGSIAWPMLERSRAAWPSDVIRHVSFREESRLFSYGRHYYQQRFNFIEPQDDLTLGDFLGSGVTATDAEIRQAAGRLGIGELLGLSFIKLSNGQTRRARIARALLSRPELLILDEPFMGVDAAGRDEISQLLGGLVHQGLRLLLITRADAIPNWATHTLRMGETVRPSTNATPRAVSSPGAPVIELRHVTVAYGEQKILDDINWIVRAGERWAVLGPNGSGKTTLLSLLCGDHPQAYSNEVILFGQRRGTGESIWDVKRRVGLVSPELHLYFTEPLTAAQTVATGFHDVLAARPTTPAQDETVRRLFDDFGIVPLMQRPFAGLSTGEQRLVLLIRALVKRPPLLILDEPFQGLDCTTIDRARSWLDTNLMPEQSLLFVSHHAEEVPATVTKYLRLHAGRVV